MTLKISHSSFARMFVSHTRTHTRKLPESISVLANFSRARPTLLRLQALLHDIGEFLRKLANMWPNKPLTESGAILSSYLANINSAMPEFGRKVCNDCSQIASQRLFTGRS